MSTDATQIHVRDLEHALRCKSYPEGDVSMVVRSDRVTVLFYDKPHASAVAYPSGKTVAEALDAAHKAIADLPSTNDRRLAEINRLREEAAALGYVLQDTPEPEPLDAETVAVRETAIADQITAAGRGAQNGRGW